MRMIFWLFCLTSGLVLELHAAEIVPPGDYTTEGAWGGMTIRPADESGNQEFEIDSVGDNGHICNLQGEIYRKQATTDAGCQIEFVVWPGQVIVDIKPGSTEQCREHCGARAGFDGAYYPRIAYCDTQTAVRGDFLRLYQLKKWVEARDTLRHLLDRCGRFLSRNSDAEVRNDLAITEFRLGNSAACLRVLEPLQPIFVRVYEKPEELFTPVDADWGRAMVKTTRFNWQKCGGTLSPLPSAARR